jgi:dTDP-4-dehydrorhamnose reductase
MIPVLITGCKGQLGSEIQRIFTKYQEMSFIFTDLEELDITRPSDIQRFLDDNPVKFLVNCAGYTAVDKAEDDEDMAYLLNADATEFLATISAERGIQLIHISTDYVFDGEKNHPYTEDDPVNPQSVYGKSKLLGEKALQRSRKGIIIRTSWLYSSFGQNFVKTILRLSGERDQLNVVFDQTGCPTYARDLAVAILEMIRSEIMHDNVPGHEIYHYSNQGMCSWYEFATSIMEFTGAGCKILPVESKDYVTKAKRPRFSVMSKEKITGEYNLRIPHWKNSLKECIDELTTK